MPAKNHLPDVPYPDRRGRHQDASVQRFALEVIARLASRGRSDPDMQGPSGISSALISRDPEAFHAYAQRALKRGQSVEAFYLTEITPALRTLGEMWEADHVSASRVLVAASRVFAVMRGIEGPEQHDVYRLGRRAVFATLPGESHTIGVSMAADLLRRQDWIVKLKIEAEAEEILSEIAQSGIDILGLSVNCDRFVVPLGDLVRDLKTRFPNLKILVSGDLVRRHPGVRRLCGADAFAADFTNAHMALSMFHADLHKGHATV